MRGFLTLQFITFVIISFTLNMWAIQLEDATFPELVTSGRANAMGNAYISRVDDASSSFYNPAGLGTVRLTHFHLSNFHLETNKALMEATTGGNVSAIGSNASKGLDLEGSRQLLLQHPGSILYNRVNLMPNITTRFFSMGYLFSLQNRSTIKDEPNALFEFHTRQDHGPYWSLNLSLFGGIIKFGGTIVLLNRNELKDERDPQQKVDIKSEDYYKGKMNYYVGGFRLTLPFAWLPTFAVVKHNALNKPFTNGRGAGVPDPIRENWVYGFSLTPQISKSIRVHLEANYKDAQGAYPEVNMKRKITAGMEFDFARKMFVRLGYGDGFGCVGMGIKSRRLEFDLTSYAVDSTESAFQGEEDRRYSLTISSGF